MSDRIYNPLHYAISVHDMDAAIGWFEDILNFKLIFKSEMTPMGFKAAFMDNGNGFELEIFEPENASPLPEERLLPNTDNLVVGNKHLAFRVDDLDTVYAEFKEKNVEMVMEPFHAFGMYCMFVYGPDKILMEFIQR